MPLAVHERLDAMVGGFDRNFRGDLGAALPTGKADGAGVLADTLNQVLINGRGTLGRADPTIITVLRGVAIGLQPQQNAATRAAAVAQLQDVLTRPAMVAYIEYAMHESGLPATNCPSL